MSFEQKFSDVIATQYSAFIKPVAEYVISNPEHSKDVNGLIEELRKAINLPEVATTVPSRASKPNITVAPPNVMGSLPLPSASTPTDSPNKKTRGKKKEEAPIQVFCDYEKYVEMTNNGAIICAYAPTSGDKKDKVCAANLDKNEDEKAKTLYERRCSSCKDKKGNIAKLAGAKSNTTGVLPKTSDLPNIGNLNLPSNLASILPGLGTIMNKSAPVNPTVPIVTAVPTIPSILGNTIASEVPVTTIKPPTPLPTPPVITKIASPKPTSPEPEPLQLKHNAILNGNKHYLAANPIPQIKNIVFHYDGSAVSAIGKLPYDVDGNIPSTYECDVIELNIEEQKIVSRFRANYKYTVKPQPEIPAVSVIPTLPVAPIISAISPPKLPMPNPSLPGFPGIAGFPAIPGFPSFPGL
jgi:hypothetical protein